MTQPPDLLRIETALEIFLEQQLSRDVRLLRSFGASDDDVRRMLDFRRADYEAAKANLLLEIKCSECQVLQ